MVVLANIAALLFVATPIAAVSTVASQSGGEKVACSKLKSKYPDNTFLPGTSGYAYETHERKSCLPEHTARYFLTKHSILVSDGIQHTRVCLRSPGCSTSLICGHYYDPHTLEVRGARRWTHANPRIQWNRQLRCLDVFLQPHDTISVVGQVHSFRWPW
jgi:hypothetical protein